MQVQELSLPGVKLLLPDVHRDDRGWFAEQYRKDDYRRWLGTEAVFVQSNLSHSGAGILRGLHLQLRKPQGKLVCVLQGSIQDVVVDMRLDSPDFGRSLSVELDDTDMRQLWVPPGFAHGFVVLSEQALVSYQCTGYYAPQDEICLRWNDPALKINWKQKRPILSTRDRDGLDLDDVREQLSKRPSRRRRKPAVKAAGLPIM